MTINIDNITVVYIILILFSSIIGYLFGRQDVVSGVSYIKNKQVSNNKNDKLISIDESKHVSDIKTDNLEKKYSTLGRTQTTEDNISNSINKLKNMKG